jgi:hypothetical protein
MCEENVLLQTIDTKTNALALPIGSGRVLPRRELLGVIAILLVFFFVCFIGRNHHLSWGDEAQTIEPAANSYYHLGFRSIAYRNSVERLGSQKFFFENVPVYPFVASLWYRVFGFSNSTAHTLNFLLMTVSAFVLWLSVFRLDIVKSSRARLGMLVVLLLGSGMTYAYMNVRYDTWGLLLCATGLLLYSIVNYPLRVCSLFVLGVLMPLSGVHLPPYICLLSVILLLFLGPSIIMRLMPLYAGMAIGVVALFGLFWWKGVIPEFLSVLHNEGGQTLHNKIQHFSYYFHLDWSLAVLLVLAMFLLFSHSDEERHNLPLRMALAFGIGLPIAFFLMRRFHSGYAWAVYTPVVICVFSALAERWCHFGRIQKTTVVALFSIACVGGLPKTMSGMLLQWSSRDYGLIQRPVAKAIRSQDVVVCDYDAYFATKPYTVWVYPVDSVSVMMPIDRERVNVLEINPKELRDMKAVLGGQWVLVGPELIVSPGTGRSVSSFMSRVTDSKFGYRLGIYRRVG